LINLATSFCKGIQLLEQRMGNVVINKYVCVCVWMGGLVGGYVWGGDTLGVQAG